MKATTVAAAAVFLGTVTADGWESWSSSDSVDSTTPVADTTVSKTPASTTPVEKTSTTPVEKTSTTPVAETSSTWSAWSSSSTPVKDTTSKTTSADVTSTWSEWSSSSTSSSTPVKDTTTDSSSSSWSAWSSTSSTPVKDSTTTESSSWSEWSSTSSSTPVKDSTTTESSSWSEWSTSSTPAAETSAEPSSWSEWETTSTPVVASTTATGTWGEWEPTETLTSTSTQWITVTVYPNDSGSSWSAWSSTPVATTTDSKTAVVSSTVTKTASSDEWAAWSTSTPVLASSVDGCQLAISVSYGPAVWYPTPVIASSTDSSSWGVWDSASSTPVVASSSASSTWAEWDGASSTSVVASSTATSTWGEWDAQTSSTSVEITSTTPASASETWSAWSQSEGAAFYEASSSSSSSATWSAWSSSATASKTGSAGGSSSTGITSNGDKFGMTYSPYTASGDCKDAGTVSKDIAAIAGKGFSSVRVYSTDCSTLENVGSAAKDHGIKIILGVFISETGISGAQPQVDAIAKWAQWDLVEIIVVGNEAVFQGQVSASDLAGFIGSSKSTFKGAGYTGAVSTTDELSIWQSQGAAWCDVVDVVTANLYAFFNPTVTAEGAGEFIQNQINDLSSVCPGKDVYVMESGWPSAGECNGAACPSPENQATAIKGIQSAVGAKVVFFSFEDESWKPAGQFGVEQHWGCGEVF